jgi:hypothetical protein
MSNRQLMTEDEIHNFGVEIVFNQIQKDGFIVESVNTDRKVDPQIVARKDGRLAFIVVRTACYPNKGEIESEELFGRLVRHADEHNATCYFASVGIANAEAENEREMSLPVKGAGFYIAYGGLSIMTFSNRVKVLGDS